jgi:hypothetical protein
VSTLADFLEPGGSRVTYLQRVYVIRQCYSSRLSTPSTGEGESGPDRVGLAHLTSLPRAVMTICGLLHSDVVTRVSNGNSCSITCLLVGERSRSRTLCDQRSAGLRFIALSVPSVGPAARCAAASSQLYLAVTPWSAVMHPPLAIYSQGTQIALKPMILCLQGRYQ